MISAHTGVAVIAVRTKVMVVPVALSGTRRILRKRGGWHPYVTVSIGAPYVPVLPEGATRKAGLQVLTAEMMAKIAETVPVERRGVYL
ncbi:MAG: hypothetical protein NVS4B12_22480 [Ktedonobacteraceae bacterium]